MFEYRSTNMLRRKAMDDLIRWRSKPEHKCLLVRGQRGVGKTTLILEFAKSYEHSVYFDLSKDEAARPIFDGDLDVDRLVDAMRILRPGSVISPGNTLIILDEIQHCPRARTALKWFTIDGRYDVIAAGSLLGVRLRDEKNDPTAIIPIGYERHLHMHGMDFEEFLWAVGYSEAQTAMLRMSVREREPLLSTTLNVYQNRFAEFMTTGGMPEAVAAFVSGEGMDRVSRILRNAVLAFRNDAMTYAPESIAVKVLKCFDSIPSQLTEINKKFMWSRIEEGSGSNDTARKYEDAFFWATEAGIADNCHRIRRLESPVSVRKDLSQFKAYMSDTGMLVDLLGPEALHAVCSKDDSFAQGALAENIVAECLVKAGVEPFHYIKRGNPGRMELDFVVELGLETAAIEVMSGKYRDTPTLSRTLDDDRIQRRIVFERSNIHTDGNGIEHYPLFAAAFIKDMAKPMPEMKFWGDYRRDFRFGSQR